MDQLNLFEVSAKPPQKVVVAQKEVISPKEIVKQAETAYKKGNLYRLELVRLIPDPEQPRKFFDEQALAELQASIVTHGVLQPILVREGKEGTFYIVSGERRYQACKNAGLESVPAIVTDGEPAEISIIENLLRENLTAIEEAEAVERLRCLHDYGLSDLATVLGKAESTISEILSLNRLPTEVKDDCRNNPKAVRSILKVIARQKTPEKMVAQYQKYRESGLVYAEIIARPAKAKIPRAKLTPEDLAAMSERLDLLLAADLTPEQKAAFLPELTKLRGVAYQKIKLFKA